jgi:hypothetical protein
MMKIMNTERALSVLITGIFLFLSFCSPKSEKKAQENSSTSGTQNAGDSAQVAVLAKIESKNEPLSSRPVLKAFDVSADTLWDDSLKKYFPTDQIARIKLAKAEYEHISSAVELVSFYRFTIPEICEVFGVQVRELTPSDMGDISPKTTWAWFTSYFPLVYGDVLCFDCVFSPMNEIVPLIKLAARTPEPEDDLFFDLAIAAYGGSGYACWDPFFQAQGWVATNECDICEASLLGDGKRMILIEKLKNAGPAHSLFAGEIDRISEKIFAIYQPHYLYSKEKVLAEIETILSSPLLTPAEKNQIREQVKDIETKSQFNCSSHSSCQWG